MKFLRDWGPALLWAAAIFLFSTQAFSGENTSRIIIPLLSWLFPSASPETLALAHFYIRKAGHVFEYFVLSLLLLRGVRGGRPGWRPWWALEALGMAVCYAGLDEAHQAFVPSRHASLYDVLLDSSGATAAQLVAAMAARVRSRHLRVDTGGGTRVA